MTVKNFSTRAKICGRSAKCTGGHSAVEQASYISREKMYCEYDKTRDQVVEELHTTKELLNLYFIHKVGVDFRTWRTNLRIEEAKTLLLENKDASINIIAEASGFSDKSNFHRQFVKIVGCSPKEWRDSDGHLS